MPAVGDAAVAQDQVAWQLSATPVASRPAPAALGIGMVIGCGGAVRRCSNSFPHLAGRTRSQADSAAWYYWR
jgi:hypothetical protein